MTRFPVPAWPVFLSMLVLTGVTARADVVLVPATLDLDATTPSGEMVLDYTGGGSANVAGYSIEVTWDPALADLTFARPVNGPFSGAVIFFVVDLGAGQVRIDAAIGGADPGIASGELALITVSGVAGQTGISNIGLTISALRDPDNQDVTGVVAVGGQADVDLGGPVISAVQLVNTTLAHTDDFVKDTDAITLTASVTDGDPGFGAGNITADLTGLGGAADAAPDSWVDPVATWTIAAAVCTPADGTVTVTVYATDPGGNAGTPGSDDITADNTAPTALLDLSVLPGHEQIHLAWTDLASSDANPRTADFRYVLWDDYPAYDSAAPTYPADHLSGTAAIEAAGTAVDWPIAPRGIYYVAGFVTDMVLLTGPAGVSSTGRATNYWLGDVGGIPDYDGVVDVITDITRLGTVYGLPDTDGGFDPECNVGPTDTRSPRGIPEPNADNEIGFEDMMVFALNYSVVTPSTKSAADGPPRLAWRRISDTERALDLLDAGDLQGLRLRADLPAGVSCTPVAGTLAAAQSAPIFLRDTPAVGLDAGLAVFGQGAGFQGEGELLRLVFSAPAPEVVVDVSARDSQNRTLAVSFEAPAEGEPVPLVRGFAGNFPNPFNPRTTLVFALPADAEVAIAVYGLDGRRVRSLLTGPRSAGRHEVEWDGRDDAGRPVAAGTWFARLTAGDLRDTRKMVLVK